MQLTTKKILGWADAHYKRTGKWPTCRSGRVFDAPDEDWSAIDGCLEYGGLGLPGGSSLASLIGRRHRETAGLRRSPSSKLTIPRILAWADEEHKRTGRWPARQDGPLHMHPDESWTNVDAALRVGHRGLPGGSSLAQLLAKNRPKALRSRGSMLTITHILAWADRHHARTRRWPTGASGPVTGVPGETWTTADEALRVGRRGLPGGSSLAKLFAQRGRKRNQRQLPRFTFAKILAWADRHHRRTGDWPDRGSGPIKEAPGESWQIVNAALQVGGRGLPGRGSLARLLAERRGRRPRNRMPKLSISRILAWADRHRARTGDWPIQTSGSVADAPENTWGAINTALSKGSRGLPGGSSLTRLIDERRSKRRGMRRRPRT